MSDDIEKDSHESKGRGGARPGAGRPKGALSKTTIEIMEAARKFTDDALAALQFVALKGKNEGARVAASTALLDRGWGRPRQAVEHTGPEGEAIEVMVTRRIVKPIEPE